MDYQNKQYSENVFTEDITRPNGLDPSRIDPFTLQQIEFFLQQQHSVHVPAVVFEYLVSNSNGRENFIGWDYDDLFDFFNHFGDIELLEIYGRISIVLFKTFFDANTAREFLQNSSNFKESEKNNFNVRWFNFDDENVISELMRSKMAKYTQRFYDGHSGLGMQNMNMNMMKMNGMMNLKIPQMNQNFGNHNNQYNQYYMMNNERDSQKNINTFQQGQNVFNNRKASNTSAVDEKEEKKGLVGSNNTVQVNNNGKYTCRFEIQVENDKEFQVARRLIGAKGCNMKRIVEVCAKSNDGSVSQDAVKLRLRGKGSGYKEGPFNKESDEPLHLCISSKFLDRYKIAIQLVNELVLNVHEEYKKFCDKTGKIPVPYLAIRKEEGISSRKNTMIKNDYDN